MPYIIQQNRTVLEERLKPILNLSRDLFAGELHYILTRIVDEYAHQVRVGGVCYDSIKDVLGTLEAVKQEFYRRVAAPYEDMKRNQNGEVYRYS